MVSGKLPFKEHQPHRMLHLIRRGPVFKPGLSSGEQHYSILLPGPSSGLESSQRLGPQSAKRMIWYITLPHRLEKDHPYTACWEAELRVELRSSNPTEY